MEGGTTERGRDARQKEILTIREEVGSEIVIGKKVRE